MQGLHRPLLGKALRHLRLRRLRRLLQGKPLRVNQLVVVALLTAVVVVAVAVAVAVAAFDST